MKLNELPVDVILKVIAMLMEFCRDGYDIINYMDEYFEINYCIMDLCKHECFESLVFLLFFFFLEKGYS